MPLRYARQVGQPPSTEDREPLPRVRLTGTQIETSRLGFGASALMSRVNRRDSVRLLETALDEGITHFDTARSYGFGEAELAVGDVLLGHRDRITVTTKVGILPPRRTLGLSATKAIARGLLSVLPSARAQLRRRAGGLVQAGCFDAKTMSASLETSLRQLRTDHVDFLLLHEPSLEVLRNHEALVFLERVRSEGKVRQFGIAAVPEVVRYAVEHAPHYAAIVQMPHSVFAPQRRDLIWTSSGAVITHSAITTQMGALRSWLSMTQGAEARWSRELQTEVAERGSLERLALQYALADCSRGMVLFTSAKPAHIRENAAALKPAASEDQLHRFAQLVTEWMRTEKPHM